MKLLRVEQIVENNRPVICKLLRDDQGTRTIIKDKSLVPYFYVPDLNGSFTVFDGSKARKIVTTLPEEVKEEREKYEKTYEADIHFTNRYLVDCVDSLEYVKPKIIYLDLEVDNSGKMPSTYNPKDIIICIGAYDNITNIYTTFICRSDLVGGEQSSIFDDRLHEIYYFKSEKDMLVAFAGHLKSSGPDIVTGWNLNSFDAIYLMNRMLNLGMNLGSLSQLGQAYVKGAEPIVKGLAFIDLMRVYRKLSENQEDSYTLDNICRKNIGEGKTEDSNNIRQLWKNDLDRLIAYNIQDVALARKLDEKLKLLDFLDEIRRTCFCQYEDTLTTTRTLDSYVLHMFKGRMVFSTKIHREEHEDFEGGFVQTWAKGVYSNVAVFDLKSLYPSIIVGLNLSPEMIDNGSTNFIEIDGVKIDQSRRGFLPEVITRLWVERSKYKKLMKTVGMDSDDYKIYDSRQKAIKVLLNGIYGQTGYHGSRFFEVKITKTTTFIGRKINEWCRNFFKGAGYEVLYADTDSNFVQMKKEDTIDSMNKVTELLNQSFDYFAGSLGIKKHNFEIEFQAIYRKIMFGTAKKRYSGHLIWKEGQTVDKISSIGFEVRRSDSSKLTKNMQTRVFEMVLKEDKTKEEVTRYIGELIDKIRKGDYKLTEIGIPKGISKDLSDYGNKILTDGVGNITHTSSVPVNIRAARYSEQVLNIQLSSKPKMIYISKLPSGLPTEFEGKKVDAICFDNEYQIPSGVIVDVETMLDKLIRAKLEAVFDALNWSMKDLDYHWKGKAPKGGSQQLLDFGSGDFGSKQSFID